MTTKEEQMQTDREDSMTHHNSSWCPINFGDCPDCEWHDNSDGACNYTLEKEAMEENYKKIVKEAFDLWSEVANKNGWSMKFVTVWVDKDGKIKDSLYSPSTATHHTIIQERS